MWSEICQKRSLWGSPFMICNGKDFLKLSSTVTVNFAMRVKCGLKSCCLVSDRFSLEIYIRTCISHVHHMILIPAFKSKCFWRTLKNFVWWGCSLLGKLPALSPLWCELWAVHNGLTLPVKPLHESCREPEPCILQVKVGVKFVSSSFLTLALDGSEWSSPTPQVLFGPTERIPGIYWVGGWLCPRAS